MVSQAHQQRQSCSSWFTPSESPHTPCPSPPPPPNLTATSPRRWAAHFSLIQISPCNHLLLSRFVSFVLSLFCRHHYQLHHPVLAFPFVYCIFPIDNATNVKNRGFLPEHRGICLDAQHMEDKKRRASSWRPDKVT